MWVGWLKLDRVIDRPVYSGRTDLGCLSRPGYLIEFRLVIKPKQSRILLLGVRIDEGKMWVNGL